MRAKNSKILLLLSFGFGAANSLGLIGAPSFLLSLLKPVDGLYSVFIAGAFFFLFQRFVSPRNMEFGRFSRGILGAFLFLFASLITPLYTEALRALVWTALAFFGLRLTKWIVSEAITLHLDPLQAKPFFFYTTILHEAGMLFMMIGIKLFPQGFSPLQMIEISAVLYCICLLLMVLFSSVLGEGLDRFPQNDLPDPQPSLDYPKALNLGVRLLALSIGVAVLCEEHLVRVVLKDHLGSYGAIRDMIATYRVIGSLLIIILGSLTGRWIRKTQPSPLLLLSINAALLMCVALLCLSTQWFLFFIVFEVSKRICEQTLYIPANNIIFSSFIAPVRNKIRSLEVFYYFNGASVPLFFLFLSIQGWAIFRQEIFILTFILLFLSVHGAVLFRFGPRLWGQGRAVMAASLQTSVFPIPSMLSLFNFEEKSVPRRVEEDPPLSWIQARVPREASLGAKNL